MKERSWRLANAGLILCPSEQLHNLSSTPARRIRKRVSLLELMRDHVTVFRRTGLPSLIESLFTGDFVFFMIQDC